MKKQTILKIDNAIGIPQELQEREEKLEAIADAVLQMIKEERISIGDAITALRYCEGVLKNKSLEVVATD